MVERRREGKRALLHVSFAIERVGHYISALI